MAWAVTAMKTTERLTTEESGGVGAASYCRRMADDAFHMGMMIARVMRITGTLGPPVVEVELAGHRYLLPENKKPHCQRPWRPILF